MSDDKLLKREDIQSLLKKLFYKLNSDLNREQVEAVKIRVESLKIIKPLFSKPTVYDETG